MRRIVASVLMASWTVFVVGCLQHQRTPASIEVGLSVPESVVHDAVDDLYLVSNINGSPFGEDGKGYISRFHPDGRVENLRWIDGSTDGVTLNAPKGMAIVGNTLYVADVTAVRKFHRVTGRSLGSVRIDGVTFLNDVTAGTNGIIYVSDTGLAPGFEATGTDAVYAIKRGDKVETVARGEDLGQPNGLLAERNGLLLVTWKTGTLNRIEADGSVREIVKLPTGQLDGIVRGPNGRYMISSWECSCIYSVKGDDVQTRANALAAPADLGYDAKRDRLLVPLFNDGRIAILH